MVRGWVLLLAALLVGGGIAAGGWLGGREVAQARFGDRFVTVKGLSEMPVRADLALWPVRFVNTGNELAAVQAKAARDQDAVLAFLRDQGLPPEAVVSRGLELVDLDAQPWSQRPPGGDRYILKSELMVRSADVDLVDRASQATAVLLNQGVALGGEPGMSTGPSFLFTRLNDVKAEMIAAATANAKEAAAQFAADSGARLGGIRRASQGVFQILPRDDVPGIMESRQIDKTLRVVATLDWMLAD